MNTNDLIIKLGDNLETLTTYYEKCITTNNYNEALNVMKNIDMLVKQLKELDFQTMVTKYGTQDLVTGEETRELAIWKQNGFGQIKDHEVFKIESGGSWCTATSIDSGFSKSQYSWYEVLKFFIETKQSQLIKLDSSNKEKEAKHRGTGKTTALLQLANDYNLPIITNTTYSTLVRDRIKELGLKVNLITDISKLSMTQYKNIDTILIDENTNSRFISDKYKIIGFQTI